MPPFNTMPVYGVNMLKHSGTNATDLEAITSHPNRQNITACNKTYYLNLLLTLLIPQLYN
jgi:hypothetical protein